MELSSKGLDNHHIDNVQGKRTEAQRAADTDFCATLFRQGFDYRAIAEKLNQHNAACGLHYEISHVQVYKDLRELQNAWLKSMADNISLYIQAELAKYDRMEKEAWDAWERSKADRKETTVAGGVIDVATNTIKGGAVKSRTSKSSYGEARWFDIILKISARRDALIFRALDVSLHKAPTNDEDAAQRQELPADLRARLVAHLTGVPALPQMPEMQPTVEDATVAEQVPMEAAPVDNTVDLAQIAAPDDEVQVVETIGPDDEEY